MAECRCGVCEHCTDSIGRLIAETKRSEVDPAVVPVPRERRLLSHSDLAAFRDGDFRARADLPRLLDAYETAVHLLEEVVRERRAAASAGGTLIDSLDVAWLALREAEK